MKYIFGPIAILALAASVQAVAVPMEHTIKLQATVPTTEFSVVPSDPSWIGDVQTLNYNAYTSTLESFSKPFDVKHTSGPIEAYLTSAPLLAGPKDNIALTVKFNDAEINGIPSEVVSAAQAAAGHTANLEIIPTEPAGGYQGGTYSGNVHVSFDAIVAAP